MQPVQYLNKMLCSFYENNVKSVEDAKKISSVYANTEQKSTLKGRSYSPSELNSLFDSLDEFEV